MKEVPIGEAARLSRVKVPTIRYYEAIDLLPSLPRSEGNRRLYGLAVIKRLAFIRHARDLGFDLEAIRTLLALQDDPRQSCSPADSIARQRLAEVEARLARLEILKTELVRMIDGGVHGVIGECRVIEGLADQEFGPIEGLPAARREED